ncbi:hypothetical protein QN375_01305 [Pseudomonas sp. MH9.2]|uniref:SLOG cluster 4 domain-containing protein n=1 Tax=unclassified Pseudomonas TaxID=196821 RepID=UPI002AC99E96|nr:MULTISPECIES: hypothetical protein [unclassified Pseudomonas]MEB0006381.1 hypothetical protein [Pseudomonas sp. RTB2]MEB0015351.1 hypothetical protein [Pseudomonas sp. RTB3]MEB0024435.1 hypothetical protein [Pseudomonas sp. MH9.2]MEB0269283.1 hypothetical protein [Pseudomonas sp. 5B4]MEE3505637.1 hypothetical protein [Pseudomonas sp. 10C3]
MPVVGVMGSGTTEWIELANPLGQWLAENGYDLVTGGGSGSMLATCRAFRQTSPRLGRSIGIVPTQPDQSCGFVPLAEYPNPFVDITIVTPLPRYDSNTPVAALSRNYVNILTSDVVIALPGGLGTLNELELAVRFSKPVMCFGPVDAFRQAPDNIERTEDFKRVCRFIVGVTKTSVASIV